jgi:predicted transcriptional regulator
MNIVREEAQKLLDKLPDQASWEDLMYEIYVSKKIEQGIKDADEGNLLSHEEAKKRLLKK